MARRKKHTDDHGGHDERWLVTYSDMITLLMAFFIMMYSMSVLNLEKFNSVAFSIRSGFGGMLEGGGQHLLTGSDMDRNPGSSFLETGNHSDTGKGNGITRLQDFIVENGLEGEMDVKVEQRGIVITIVAEGVLFAPGSATMTSKAHTVLAQVTTLLKEATTDILVEGHTDDLPINTAAFPSNWELSAARASMVVREFATHDIPGKRLVAVGYGSTRPRVPNNTAANRGKNRRVNVVITNNPSGGSGIDAGSLRSNAGPSHDSRGGLRPRFNKVFSSEGAAPAASEPSASEGGQGSGEGH